jgi:hypothetical protein
MPATGFQVIEPLNNGILDVFKIPFAGFDRLASEDSFATERLIVVGKGIALRDRADGAVGSTPSFDPQIVSGAPIRDRLACEVQFMGLKGCGVAQQNVHISPVSRREWHFDLDEGDDQILLLLSRNERQIVGVRVGGTSRWRRGILGG